MADIVDPATRSRMMSGIRDKHTRPELLLRKLLHASGFRFRLHRRDLPGSPDIVLPIRNVAIFVNGCFWHAHEGCRFATLPRSRQSFWKKKLEGNRARDHVAVERLLDQEWRVLVVWECALRSSIDLDRVSSKVGRWIRGKQRYGAISLLAGN